MNSWIAGLLGLGGGFALSFLLRPARRAGVLYAHEDRARVEKVYKELVRLGYSVTFEVGDRPKTIYAVIGDPTENVKGVTTGAVLETLRVQGIAGSRLSGLYLSEW